MKIKWSFAQMCCPVSLVCSSGRHITLVSSEHVNIPKTIVSPTKCEVRQWCKNFEAGCTDVHDAGGQGRKRVSTDDPVWVDQAIWENCQLISVLYWYNSDHLFGIVVSTSDCHPRGPGFDSQLYPRNFSRSMGSGMGSTQPREANWVAAWYEK